MGLIAYSCVLLISCVLSSEPAKVNSRKHFYGPIWESRIIETGIVQPYGLPYVASVLVVNTNSEWIHQCSGAIINERWIVTVAHCVVGTNVSTMRIRVGFNPRPDYEYTVDQTIVHPHFNNQTRKNDISTVRSSRIIDFNSGPHPIEIVLLNDEKAYGIVTSWKRANEQKTQHHSLDQLFTSTMIESECSNNYADIPTLQRSLDENNICSWSGVRGFCVEDFGAPLAVSGKLVGLLSWTGACLRPDVYTRVGMFHVWIQDNSEI